MPTLRTIVEEVSKYLVDQEPDFEFEHWSEDEILTYARDAMRIIAGNLKSLFVNQTTVTLQPGTLQRLPEGCTLVGVLGTVRRDGTVNVTARRTSNRTLGLLRGKVCAPSRQEGDGYEVSEFQVDSSNSRTFYVQPPVPAGTAPQISVSCFGAPAIKSLDQEFDFPDHLIPALKEFMLYYAYGVDTESVPARDYMKVHWQNAVTLLGAEKVNQAINAIDLINVDRGATK